jgi:GT2 family glycosyltransferase
MKLSIVILCWNDLKVIGDCLASIYSGTHSIEFETIVSDNGSTDGSIDFIRKNFPQVRILENGTNLRFAKGNNVAIRASQGEYVLILNPDTIIHDGALDKVVKFADEHPEAGAFGCKVLNVDGSVQEYARPFPTIRSEWFAAFYLKPLAFLSDSLHHGVYTGWKGDTERAVGWLAGCFIVVRASLLKELGGFDEQFFYYYEDQDLCRRISDAGYPILYTPEMTITHLGGQSTIKRFPMAFALDSQVTHYLYYYKHYGRRGARQCRWFSLTSAFLRRIGYGLLQLVNPTEARKNRLVLLRRVYDWNLRVDPVRLVENGEEPSLEGTPGFRVLDR